MGIAELKARAEKVLMPAYLRYHAADPLGIVSGKGARVIGHDGKEYIDGFGQVCTISVGHCDEEINAAVHEQVEKLWHAPSLYYSDPIVAAAEALTAVMPVPDTRVFWVNSGTEATEFSAQLASLATGRNTFLCFRGSFHGRTRFSASITMQGAWRKRTGVIPVANVYPLPTPYAYREMPDGMKRDDHYYRMVLAEIGRTIRDVCGDQLAGVFVEPMLGNGGVIYGPSWFYDELVELVHKAGGLVIADEVQTGVGRTGQWWGTSWWDKQPDIWNMAKGLGNGFPVGATVARKEVAEAFSGTTHFSTYGGNPLAMVVVKKVLEIVGREKTQQNVTERGRTIRTWLGPLMGQHRLIGDIRGEGLMIGVELVRNRQTREPFDITPVMDACRARGVLVGKGGLGNVIRIKPPYCLTRDDATMIVNVLDEALTEVEARAAT